MKVFTKFVAACVAAGFMLFRRPGGGAGKTGRLVGQGLLQERG